MSIRLFFRKHNIGREFILFTLIVMATCYLYYEHVYKGKGMHYQNKQMALRAVEDEIAALSSAGGDIKEKEERLKNLQKKYDELSSEQQRLFSKFPNRAQASNMLKEIISEERFAGVSFESFRPMAEIPTANGYNYLPLQINVTGAFSDVGDYIKYIENLPRILVIDDIDFKVLDEENSQGTCTAMLRGRTFVLRY